MKVYDKESGITGRIIHEYNDPKLGILVDIGVYNVVEVRGVPLKDCKVVHDDHKELIPAMPILRPERKGDTTGQDAQGSAQASH